MDNKDDEMLDSDILSTLAKMDAQLKPKDLSENRKDALKNKIFSRLDQNSEDPQTKRLDEGEWFDFLPKIRKKVLNSDKENNRETYLLKMEAGSSLPAYKYAHHGELYVLEGDVVFGRFRVTRGDFHTIPAGFSHPEGISEKGALLLMHSGGISLNINSKRRSAAATDSENKTPNLHVFKGK